MVEAEKSGASVVLALLRASVASKSIRVIELFNALDTSKDGLISRWEEGERPLFRRRGGLLYSESGMLHALGRYATVSIENYPKNSVKRTSGSRRVQENACLQDLEGISGE